jgi:hypothetical protein
MKACGRKAKPSVLAVRSTAKACQLSRKGFLDCRSHNGKLPRRSQVLVLPIPQAAYEAVAHLAEALALLRSRFVPAALRKGAGGT